MLVDAIYSLLYFLPLSCLKACLDRRKCSLCTFKFTSFFDTLLSINADLLHRRLGLLLFGLVKLFLNDVNLVYKCFLNKLSCEKAGEGLSSKQN